MNVLMRFSKIFIASVLVFSIILSVNNVARADVGELPAPGGLITTGDKNTDVSMAAENVVFKVKDNDGVVFDKAIKQYAHVKADFTMHNASKTKQTKKLFFPFHFMNDVSLLKDMAQAKNVKVVVALQEKPVTYQQMGLPDKSTVLSGVFDADFAPESDTNITVEYDLRAVNEGKSSDVSFKYMMQTGSQWVGSIGKGRVVFDFDKDITSNIVFSNVNDFFKIVDGNLQWDFTNLEPTAAHDITVTYDPANMATWFARPSYISDISVSNYTHGGVYISDGLRTNESMPGGKWNANPINLMDTTGTRGGWATEQKTSDVNQWVEYTFDNLYTFTGMQIRAGYQDAEWSSKDNKNVEYYDTFRRPKTMVMTFSDGSTQTVVLKDLPSQMQNVELPAGKKMNSIKLAFADAYPGVGGGNDYFGIGRINFVGAQKAAATTTTMKNTSLLDGLNLTNILIIGGAILGGLLIGGGAVALLVRRKSAGKVKTPASTFGSPTTPDQTAAPQNSGGQTIPPQDSNDTWRPGV